MEATKRTGAVWQSAITGLKLLLICAVIAGIVSLVYSVTLDTYNKNLQATKDAAMGEIFGRDDLTGTRMETTDGSIIYSVKAGETDLGYCVESAADGFGGALELMVGYSPEGKIIGVSIVALSETPGLGSKVNDAAYLEQYIGGSGELTLGGDVDAISGATVSSRAVITAVNRATAALNANLASVGGEQE